MTGDPAALVTDAEARADVARSLPAFVGLSLPRIKSELAESLALIGRGGIFDEYTKHDVTHVNEMLRMLDWLVRESTKSIMTPADWLMTVLGVYLHDLGMLVTKSEYERRNQSAFPDYRDRLLFAKQEGADYRAKLDVLTVEEKERLLYQEFVRHTHGERVAAWIDGTAGDRFGVAPEMARQVAGWLGAVDVQLRLDLALVCESHHLDDLFDLRKYRTRRAYGNSDDETANLQYACLLLRTADLLHITRDRTPGVVFRLINPSDPLSQREWAKQSAVRRVCSKLGRDSEGNADEKAPRDTVEVHATFRDQEGFFGLSAYLAYAELQLAKSHEWGRAGNREGAKHQFPWRKIDDTNIETLGFLRESYQFTIDQAKILDLLTGHTLYNDTRVVLRELVQNALDAVRLQEYVGRKVDAQAKPGGVFIEWDTASRTLTVTDNGTGMTQAIIENHLLKVGASRYQDEDFIREHPGFTPISRFGIGVLSTFMIADTVEIVTCHTDEDQARQLSLRSVHGRYLVRLLDKQTNAEARLVAPHGTLVRLRLRPTAKTPDVLENARHWVVVPGCEVSVRVDASEPARVGFSSPEAALRGALEDAGVPTTDEVEPSGTGAVRVVQREQDGLTLAYALEWSELFRDWGFMSDVDARAVRGGLGLCVQGIRVDSAPPGFPESGGGFLLGGPPGIVAIANCTGDGTPRTNVARSGLEATPERDVVTRTAYRMYCDEITREIDRLSRRPGGSVTWAAEECCYLVRQLVSAGPSEERLFLDAASGVPFLLLEEVGERTRVSLTYLRSRPRFWTVDSQLSSHAEWLLREIPGTLSLSALMRAADVDGFELPDGPVLCGMASLRPLRQWVFAEREVEAVRIHREQRRLDLCWSPVASPRRWLGLGLPSTDTGKVAYRALQVLQFSARDHFRPPVVGVQDVEIAGRTTEAGVRSMGTTYLFPRTDIARYLAACWREADLANSEHAWSALVVALVLVEDYARMRERTTPVTDEDIREAAARLLEPEVAVRLGEFIEVDDLISAVNAMGPVFDASVWVRKSG